ncbi:MAG: DUF1553 domain-containing protein, partial [Planctomycetaceae bacterium]
ACTEGRTNPDDATNPKSIAFFESRIRPVLVEKCQSCHSGDLDAPKGGLRLDSREGLLSGGDSGPAIHPGDAAASVLVRAIRYDGLEMPPSARLPREVVEDFEQWVNQGAVDPRIESTLARTAQKGIDVEAGRSFWAFRPIRRPVPPAPEAVWSDWPRRDLDRFILSRVLAEGLEPTRDADATTWLRRVHFDLVGLPPSPESIEDFLADTSSEARATVVERLLASPRFGERWGRHWLDIARYAESSGGGRSMVFKEAWRYRDYVIGAFNADMPFDRFVREQIAGDLLPHASDKDEHDHLVATGYLLLGPINYEEQDKRQLEMDVVDEQLDTIGRGLMAMTLGCARCHDHKFDPIPTADYYAMAGVLRSTDVIVHQNVSRWTERKLPMDEATAAVVAEHDRELAGAKESLADAKKTLARLDPGSEATNAAVPLSSLPGIVLDDGEAVRVGEWTGSHHVKPFVGQGYLTDGNDRKGEKTLTFQPRFERPGLYEVRIGYTAGPNRASAVPIAMLTLDGEIDRTVDMRTPPPADAHFVSLGTFRFDETNQWYLMVSNRGTDGYVIVDCVQFLPADAGSPRVTADPSKVVAAVPAAHGRVDDATELSAARDDVKRLEERVKALTKSAPSVPMAMAADDTEKVVDLCIRIRGDVHSEGRQVPRGVLSVATIGAPPVMPREASGRNELALWIADSEHPLTSRGWGNRVWKHLFGEGIVRSVDNFGSTGETPSHPDLLDFLARSFSDSGWSTKKLVRDIVLSRTYSLSTAVGSSRQAEVDPENRLLSRFPRRRLEAEVLRDAMLAISGRLDLTAGGSGISDERVLSGVGTDMPTEYGYVFNDLRRSVYSPAFRNRRPDIFDAFDAADPNGVTGSRSTSTVAPQALFMLNSPFVMEEAEWAARRLLADTVDRGDLVRIELAFLRSIGRPPSPAEREAVLEMVRKVSDESSSSDDAASGDGAADPEAESAAWAGVFQAVFGCIDFRTLE